MTDRSQDFQHNSSGADFGSSVANEVSGLFRYAATVAGDLAEAEDLVGETVVRALERQSQFRGEASLKTWLHRILYNIAVDRARRHSHEISASAVETLWGDEDYSVDVATVVAQAETQAELRDALVHLPYIYRAVVVLHDGEGWSVAEIATILSIGLPATKQRLRRGRMMLVSALAGQKERAMENKGLTLSCWDARIKVSDYLDGDLNTDERNLLESHLAICTTCPPLYQALVGVKEALGAHHDPNSVIPPEIIRRIREKMGYS